MADHCPVLFESEVRVNKHRPIIDLTFAYSRLMYCRYTNGAHQSTIDFKCFGRFPLEYLYYICSLAMHRWAFIGANCFYTFTTFLERYAKTTQGISRVESRKHVVITDSEWLYACLLRPCSNEGRTAVLL